MSWKWTCLLFVPAIVVPIVLWCLNSSPALSADPLRGWEVLEGCHLVIQALERAKQLAARQGVPHFLVLENSPSGGRIRIVLELNGPDLLVVDLPSRVDFEPPYQPEWLEVHPDGSVELSPGFGEVRAATFDTSMNQALPTGDIVIKQRNESMRVCLDVDLPLGRIRRFQLMTQ